MPTHPECLYYLYKGYTHEVYMCAREIKTHCIVVYMEKGSVCSVMCR